MYRLGDIGLVQTVDFIPPPVADPFIYGQIAAANALSDIYAMGASPVTGLNIAAFPDKQLPLSILRDIFRGAMERVEKARCSILGGHTIRSNEILFGLAVSGKVSCEKIITNFAAKAGDKLVLTKALGTGFIIAANMKKACSGADLNQACAGMVALNASACNAMVEVGAHAATDITGFGLAGHALEMARASGKTFHIHLDRLPLLPNVQEYADRKFFTRANRTNEKFVGDDLRIEGAPPNVLREILFDPQTSGGLLISVAEDHVKILVEKALQLGAPTATVIGQVHEKEDVSLVAHAT